MTIAGLYTAENVETNSISHLIVTESKSHPSAAAQENI